MEFLDELNVEQDYDKMCSLLVSANNTSSITTLYPEYNAKVLLTAFMIKNFPDVYADENLLKQAGEICKALLKVDHFTLSQIYHEYFQTFLDWRNNDICNLKTSIELQKETLRSVAEPEPSDEADEQWNEGIEMNIQTLDKHIEKLDTYSKTPPIEIPK
jgi:hypothetical protein